MISAYKCLSYKCLSYICYRCLCNIVTDPLAKDSHEKIARTQHQPHAGASPESMEWKRVAGQGLQLTLKDLKMMVQVCSERPSKVL